jgi:hypothetical protein
LNGSNSLYLDTGNGGYFNQIGSAVVDNLQIKIKNIHIRYEDAVSCPGVVLLLNSRHLVWE